MRAQDRSSKIRSVTLVGPLPPPAIGTAIVNERLCIKMGAAGLSVICLNVGAFSVHRSFPHRLVRFARIAIRLLHYFWLLITRRGGDLYLCVSGGAGQLYDLMFVAMARVFSRQIFMHHHSFAYLDLPNRTATALMHLAGSNTLHVVLCHEHGRQLKTSYPVVRNYATVSNADLISDLLPITPTPRNLCRTIGFFSNISFDKGVMEYLDVVFALHNNGLPIRAVFGGPFDGKHVEHEVMRRLTELPFVEYLGPQHGDAKARFYEDIDVLLFPSRYRNETAPLVIYEALAFGIPVIASDRGCIPEILGNGPAGLVIRSNQNYVSIAKNCITQWMRDPERFRTAARAARERYNILAATAQPFGRMVPFLGIDRIT